MSTRDSICAADGTPVEWRVLARNQNYAVSDSGYVKRLTKARGARVGRILRSHLSGSGYPMVVLYENNIDKSVSVHSLIAETFIGPRPDGHDVNHIDGNKLNNSARNLEYVTRSANQTHAYANGLNHASWGKKRLTNAERADIATDGETAKETALRYGVSLSYVYSLRRRRAR